MPSLSTKLSEIASYPRQPINFGGGKTQPVRDSEGSDTKNRDSEVRPGVASNIQISLDVSATATLIHYSSNRHLSSKQAVPVSQSGCNGR